MESKSVTVLYTFAKNQLTVLDDSEAYYAAIIKRIENEVDMLIEEAQHMAKEIERIEILREEYTNLMESLENA